MLASDSWFKERPADVLQTLRAEAKRRGVSLAVLAGEILADKAT
jgi:hypothetical protein